MAVLPKVIRQARPARLARRMISGGQPPARQPTSPHAIDVWQWTLPKYRRRAVLLLLLNALLFVGLGCFTLWLRTGAYVMPSSQAYWSAWWSAFDPTTEQQQTLIDYLLYPIPVDQVPMMMIIIGLLLAAMTAIPILVAMLYGFWFSLIFTIIIAFVAMLPWLGLTTTLCCALSRWRPLRFSFHYATALIAMLPAAAYYVLATRNTSALATLPPIEMAKLYVPWVLAVVAACVLLGVGLLLARLVTYRPGAIAPLLALMFALPAVLFEVYVGRDELHYRLLEQSFGPGSRTHFVDNLTTAQLVQRLTQQRQERESDLDLGERSLHSLVGMEVKLRLETLLAEQQQEAATACLRFRNKYPQSRYIANVLYLQGRAQDMRIDHQHLEQRGVLRYFSDFPRAASEPLWQALHDDEPRSALWPVACLRLGSLWARTGRVDAAVEVLEELAGRPDALAVATSTAPADTWMDLLAKRPASDTLGVDLSAVRLEARKLYDLIVSNRDPEQADQALQALLRCIPRDPSYRNNLKQLRNQLDTRFPRSALGDNLDLLLAISDPSLSRRIDMLRRYLDQMQGQPGSDAIGQARYELAMAYREDSRTEEARELFEQVIRLHPDSVWALEANRRLASMGGIARSTRPAS